MKISRTEGFIRWYQLFGEGMKTWRRYCRADILLIMLSKQPHQIPFTANSSSLAPHLFMYTGQGQLIGGSITTQSAPTYPPSPPPTPLWLPGVNWSNYQHDVWLSTMSSALSPSPVLRLLLPQNQHKNPVHSAHYTALIAMLQGKPSSWNTRKGGQICAPAACTNRLHLIQFTCFQLHISVTGLPLSLAPESVWARLVARGCSRDHYVETFAVAYQGAAGLWRRCAEPLSAAAPSSLHDSRLSNLLQQRRIWFAGSNRYAIFFPQSHRMAPLGVREG